MKAARRQPPPPPRSRWDAARPLLAALALVALVAAVYWPSLHNGFIWDDELYVQNNLALRSLAGLRDIWFRIGTTPQYYPLVYSTFWLEYQLWELAPAGYHVTNLALHAIAAVLVWRLLARLDLPGAWLAAAIFAVHPVQVESVAWVTERKNVLSLVFALCALLAYLRASPPEAPAGARPRSGLAYGSALAFYLAALFAKTVTASTPAVLLVIYWWKRGRVTLRDLAWLAPFFAVGLGMSWVTVWMEKTHVGASGSEWDFSFAERLLLAGRAAWFYAGKLVWPHPLAFFYPRWTPDTQQLWQAAFPLAVALLVVALFLARARIGRGALAAVLIFVGVLTPALGFFDVYPFRYSFVADHFQYHASIAVIALLAAVGARAAKQLSPILATAIAVAVVVALGATARREVPKYRDLPTLYESVIRVNPDSWAAQNNLGKYLQNEGRYAEALEHLQAAVRLAPQQARVRNNLGSTLSSLGRYREAEAELRRALASDGEPTDRADSRVYLGVTLIQQGRFAEAVDPLRTALEFRPGDPWILYNLGVALGGSGDLVAGAASVRESLAANPRSAIAHHELGSMLRARRRSQCGDRVVRGSGAARTAQRGLPGGSRIGPLRERRCCRCRDPSPAFRRDRATRRRCAQRTRHPARHPR